MWSVTIYTLWFSCLLCFMFHILTFFCHFGDLFCSPSGFFGVLHFNQTLLQFSFIFALCANQFALLNVFFFCLFKSVVLGFDSTVLCGPGCSHLGLVNPSVYMLAFCLVLLVVQLFLLISFILQWQHFWFQWKRGLFVTPASQSPAFGSPISEPCQWFCRFHMGIHMGFTCDSTGFTCELHIKCLRFHLGIYMGTFTSWKCSKSIRPMGKILHFLVVIVYFILFRGKAELCHKQCDSFYSTRYL